MHTTILSSSPLSSSKIRVLIVLFSLATLAPMIGLVAYFNLQSKHQLEAASTQQLTLVAQITAVEHLQIAEGARQLLIAISSSPEIRSPNACSIYLSNLLTKFRRYSNFGVVDRDGNIFCSAVHSVDPTNVADKYFFQQTLKTNSFTVGQFAIGSITKRATVYFGYPVQDAQGNIAAVAYVSLDLSWFSELLQELSLDPSISINVVDRQGYILSSFPSSDHAVGTLYPHLDVEELQRKTTGEFYDKPKNETILYSMRNIGSDESGPYVVLEIPEKTIAKKSGENIQTYLALSFGALILSLSFGLWVGTLIITSITRTLGKIDELKHDFVSLASHQIRTPLTAIRWNAEHLLSLTPHLPKQHNEIVLDIQTSVSRIISLVALLLDTSKLESGSMRLSTTYTSISELVREVIDELPKEQRKSHLIRVICPKNLPKIPVDAKLLKQVYANLLNNAIHYSPPHTPIVITLQKKHRTLVSSVIDQGIGVPPEDRPHIFDKFFRAKNVLNSSITGSGLGLYLSKLILEGHHGKIWYEQRKKGSCFAFLLPLV